MIVKKKKKVMQNVCTWGWLCKVGFVAKFREINSKQNFRKTEQKTVKCLCLEGRVSSQISMILIANRPKRRKQKSAQEYKSPFNVIPFSFCSSF